MHPKDYAKTAATSSNQTHSNSTFREIICWVLKKSPPSKQKKRNNNYHRKFHHFKIKKTKHLNVPFPPKNTAFFPKFPPPRPSARWRTAAAVVRHPPPPPPLHPAAAARSTTATAAASGSAASGRTECRGPWFSSWCTGYHDASKRFFSWSHANQERMVWTKMLKPEILERCRKVVEKKF